MTDIEQIVLLNEQYQPIGVAPKLASHHANTPLHLAFSCYVFNQNGEFLLTQRAATKKVWPGVWTNSVCGHPAPNEDMGAAIQRRLDFELGMSATDFQPLLPNYRYKTEPFNGIIENEFCPVYIARATSDPKPNPDEVGDYKWINWEQLIQDLAISPKNYSYWFKDQVQHITSAKPAHTLLLSYLN